MSFLYELMIQIGLGESISRILSFFIYEVVYLSIVLLVGITVFTFIRLRFLGHDFNEKLKGKPKWMVYLGMAFLGIISPFCSCSTIPIFVSFATLGVPTGALFVFLITSPMVQEASLILLLTEFGVAVAAIYIMLGVITGIVVGSIISRVSDSALFNKAVLDKREGRTGEELKSDTSCTQDTGASNGSCCTEGEEISGSCCSQDTEKSSSCCSQNTEDKESGCCCEKGTATNKENLLQQSMKEASSIFKGVFKFIVIGIMIGAFIYGVVPDAIIENLLGTSNVFAPVLATLFGIPIYADDVALIPVAKILVDSGAGLGTALSFVMSSAVVSVPSFIMLSAVLKKKTIIKLVGFLIVAIITIGYIFNWLAPMIF